MEDIPSNLSYLNPRDPSIYLGNRPFGTKRINLLSRFGDETEHEHMSKNKRVKVYLRIKPMKKDPTLTFAVPQVQTFEVKDSQTLVTRSLKDSVIHEFQFTKIFSGPASQEDIYTECVHDLVKGFINGQNCLLFAYGTSSAGKTYTIQGTSQEPGIIPRAINVLFNSIHGKQSQTCRLKPEMVNQVVELDDKAVHQEIAYKQQIMSWSQDKYHVLSGSQVSEASSDKHSDYTSTSMDSQVPDFVSSTFRDMQVQLNNSSLVSVEGQEVVFSVWVSFAEVYNENVYDLLEPVGRRNHRRQNLALGEDNKGQVYIKGLRHICVTSADEAYQVMLYGQHNLKFAPTALNIVSSRSHCIFTVKLLQHAKCEHPKFVRVSMFSFCDLAGAERAKRTQNVGERLKESQNINTSLLVLGRCLMTIRDNQMCRSKKLIPFRDSKLTRLFQRALNGNECFSMIVNVNPTSFLREETFNVLMFSAVAKQIILLPARHRKRVPRSSRFSQYISKSSTLISDGTCEGDISTSPLPSSRDNQHLYNQIETLVNKVGELKKQLAVEHAEKLSLEAKVRQELCDQFSSMMVEAQADWKSRLEDTQHRYEQMGDWRVNKLQEYYEQQLKRKRHCADNDSEGENTTMQDIDAEVACLQEKLLVSDELLKASRKECSELSSKCSKLMFELAQCKSSLKNSEKLKEAAQAACEGDRSVLIKELESQLAAMREELCKRHDKIQELDGILEDAQIDCKQLEDDLKATEKERDNLDLKLVEKESELRHGLDALSDRQRILDKQLLSLDEKDEHIEILEKKLKELHEKYDSDMKTMTMKTEELEERLKISLMDNKLLKSEEENNTENVHTLQSEVEELKNKLKESEEKLLQAEAMEQTHQKEIENLKHINNDLEYKLSAVEKAEKTAIKEMISAQNCAEEHRKLLEENTLKSQKEISKLKMQLQSCMDNAEFVRLLKEELEGKSFKFEQLESENECLKKSLEVKEVEMVHFKENRDNLLKAYENMLKKEKEDTERYKREVQRYQQMFFKNTPTPNKSEYEMKIRKLSEDLEKKDQELKGCYVKLVKLGGKYKCGNQHEVQNDESQSTVLSDSKDVNRQRTRTRTRTKAVDENTQPPLTSSEKKYASRTQSNSVGKKQGCNEKTKSRIRRKNLFSCNLDESTEITPVETEEIPPSMSPTRILRSHRR